MMDGSLVAPQAVLLKGVTPGFQWGGVLKDDSPLFLQEELLTGVTPISR